MRQSIERMLLEIEKLPSGKQDQVAARVIAELSDDEAWDARVEATTNDQWDKMARAVREEIAQGISIDYISVSRSRSSAG